MRLTLLCVRAATLPTVMVSAATHQSTRTSSGPPYCGCASRSSRARAPKPAALTAVAMKAVTAVGAPS